MNTTASLIAELRILVGFLEERVRIAQSRGRGSFEREFPAAGIALGIGMVIEAIEVAVRVEGIMFFRPVAAAALELHSREVELRWLSPMGSMTALLDRRFSS